MTIGSYAMNVAQGVAEDTWGFLGKLKEVYPAFSCFWDVELPMKVIQNNQSVIKLNDSPIVKSISSPFFTKFSKESWSTKSNKYSLPGIENTDNIVMSVKVIEDNLAKASRYAMAYRHCIKNIDGTYNYPSNYIDTLRFNIYTNKGQLLLTFNFAVWLESAAYENREFGYEESDTKIIIMNYDFSVIDFNLELNKLTLDFLKNKANEVYNNALDWAGNQIDKALESTIGANSWLKEVSNNKTFSDLCDLGELTGISKRTIF